MNLCWKPSGRQLDFLPECLHTRKCCLPQQQSRVWWLEGPHLRLLSRPSSETLLQKGKSCWRPTKTEEVGVFLQLWCHILTYIKAIDSWETFSGIGAGHTTKQIQLALYNTEKEAKEKSITAGIQGFQTLHSLLSIIVLIAKRIQRSKSPFQS